MDDTMLLNCEILFKYMIWGIQCLNACVLQVLDIFQWGRGSIAEVTSKFKPTAHWWLKEAEFCLIIDSWHLKWWFIASFSLTMGNSFRRAKELVASHTCSEW